MKKLYLTVFIVLMGIFPATAQQHMISVTDAYGNKLQVQIDSTTGSAHRIYGELPNINSLGYQRENLTLHTIKELSSQFFSVYRNILKINPSHMSMQKANTDGKMWFVSYRQTVDNIPVWGTEIGYTINQAGDIVVLGADAYQNVKVSTTPGISKDAALNVAKEAFAIDSTRIVDPGTLTIYPVVTNRNVTYNLTWKVALSSRHPLKEIVYFVDAITGGIVDQFSNLHSADNIEKKPQGQSRYSTRKVTTSNPLDRWFYVKNMNHATTKMSSNIQGTVTGNYYPEHYYDTPVQSAYPTTEIKIYNYLGQLVYEGSTDSNGNYSSNLASSIYEIHIPLQNSWVQVRDHSNNDNVFEDVYEFSSNVDHDVDWGVGDASNVRYHASRVHDYFKDTFGYSTIDYQMQAMVNSGASTNGAADGTNIFFGSDAGQYWARSSDVVYHEYTHNTIYHIYGGWIGNGTIESSAMDEGLSDYYACTLNDDHIQGESVGVYRDLSNTFTFDATQPNPEHWNGQVIGGAVWDVRQAVGANIGDNLAFKAMQITPHAHTFSDYLQNMLTADDNYYSGSYESQILTAFDNHGIDSPSPTLTVSISGPQTLSQQDGIGYWTANVSGGVSPYSYQWQARNTCRTGYNCGSETWQPAGTQQTISYTYSSSVYSLELKVTVTDNQSTSTTAGIYTVYYDPPSYSLTTTGPNPFNPTTNLSYALPEQADVTMEVYNIMGRKVATLADGSKQPGRYTVRFDASHLASGMYLVHFTARTASGQITRKTMKLQLLK